MLRLHSKFKNIWFFGELWANQSLKITSVRTLKPSFLSIDPKTCLEGQSSSQDQSKSSTSRWISMRIILTMTSILWIWGSLQDATMKSSMNLMSTSFQLGAKRGFSILRRFGSRSEKGIVLMPKLLLKSLRSRKHNLLRVLLRYSLKIWLPCIFPSPPYVRYHK